MEPLGSFHTLTDYLSVVVLVREVLEASSAADFVALLAYQFRLLFLWYLIGALFAVFKHVFISSGNGSTFGIGLNRQFVLDHQILLFDFLPFLLGKAKVVHR